MLVVFLLLIVQGLGVLGHENEFVVQLPHPESLQAGNPVHILDHASSQGFPSRMDLSLLARLEQRADIGDCDQRPDEDAAIAWLGSTLKGYLSVSSSLMMMSMDLGMQPGGISFDQKNYL